MREADEACIDCLNARARKEREPDEYFSELYWNEKRENKLSNQQFETRTHQVECTK